MLLTKSILYTPPVSVDLHAALTCTAAFAYCCEVSEPPYQSVHLVFKDVTLSSGEKFSLKHVELLNLHGTF